MQNFTNNYDHINLTLLIAKLNQVMALRNRTKNDVFFFQLAYRYYWSLESVCLMLGVVPFSRLCFLLCLSTGVTLAFMGTVKHSLSAIANFRNFLNLTCWRSLILAFMIFHGSRE